MDNYKVSIIIPVYNTEKFLKKCMDSIVNQTLKEIEIICINDGSTDNSLKILEEYATNDNRIKLINQNNLGQGTARNKGLEIACGEYIGFVDSDDWIDEDYFEKLYNSAKKHNAALACCSLRREYPFKQSWRLHVEKEEIIETPMEKFKYLYIPKQCYPVNKIYRKADLDKHNIKFPEGMYFEDMPFNLNAVYYLDKMVTVPGIIYHYFANMKSTVKCKNDKKQTDLIKAWSYFRSFSKKHNIQLDEKYYITRKHAYKIFGITCLKVYEWKATKKYLLFGFIPFMKRITYSS